MGFHEVKAVIESLSAAKQAELIKYTVDLMHQSGHEVDDELKALLRERRITYLDNPSSAWTREGGMKELRKRAAGYGV